MSDRVLPKKAVTLFAANNFKGAYLIHKKNLDVEHKNDNDYARILSNYANTRWRIDNKYNPLPDLHKALNIRLKSSDNYGLNSSYAHLFDYHYGRNADSAKMYALKSFASANKIDVSADRINAAEKLIKVSDADSSKYYFQVYKHLDDSVRSARLKARNQYALIRYESEKNKIHNLKLQKDVLDRDLRISEERILMVIVFGGVLSGLIYYILWARKRKQRMTMELENKVKEIQLTTSKKVHDVVANGIYRVMTELEYKDDYDKQDLLDKLEVMYEKSRDISYEPSKDMSLSTFVSDVSTLLGSFSNEKVRIIIVGNDPHIWNRVPKKAKDDLLIIFQELLVNMRKHSLADEVIFRFEETDNYLNIFYQDNGVGLSSIKKEGNGLRNTGTRMERLNGKFNFGSEDGKGLKIEIILPLPQNKAPYV
ncbi:ATP-binding protein [Sphingobacterium sp. DK4209]|uniref:ATP-binding protein n=1 Tax=Sphingobacterium zhuxiongii TaxID=2662364 RepID=A0A5Q0QDF8_9SPHI|nr:MULTISPECIES: ATP-binding protein [unclassified Sphingobacterium]MVZ64622.1 ATP-binding protein [Sphingobacterium sp. DK4209]QGA26961.1 ATP-binding protein [Sphingobacterium sp. dk4302]